MNNKFFEIDLSIYDKEGKLLHETALTAPTMDLVNKLCNKEHNIKVISEQGYGSVNYVIIEVTKRALKNDIRKFVNKFEYKI